MPRKVRPTYACYFCGHVRAGRWVSVLDGVEGWVCDPCFATEVVA
jgi:Zn-finger protein